MSLTSITEFAEAHIYFSSFCFITKISGNRENRMCVVTIHSSSVYLQFYVLLKDDLFFEQK